MKTNRLFLFAALLGTVLVGCQKEKEFQKPDEQLSENQAWTLHLQMAKSLETKALALDQTGTNDKIVASWKQGEKVAVYFGKDLLGTLEVTSADDVDPATLEGQISKPSGLVANSDLLLLFPGREDNLWTYVGQDGTAPTAAGKLSTLFDYATATLKVGTIDTDNLIINIDGINSDANFTNKQSVYRFGFKVDGTGDNIAVKSFTLSTSGGNLVRSYTNTTGTWTATDKGPITVTPAAGISDNIYYMSVCNENTDTEDYTFSVVDSNSALYEGVKSIPGNAHGTGKLISARNISVTKKTMAPDKTSGAPTISVADNVL